MNDDCRDPEDRSWKRRRQLRDKWLRGASGGGVGGRKKCRGDNWLQKAAGGQIVKRSQVGIKDFIAFHSISLYCSSSYFIASYFIVFNRIVYHRISSYRIVSYFISSYSIVVHRIVFHGISLYLFHRIVFHRISSFRNVSYFIVFHPPGKFEPDLRFQTSRVWIASAVPQKTAPEKGEGSCETNGYEKRRGRGRRQKKASVRQLVTKGGWGTNS